VREVSPAGNTGWTTAAKTGDARVYEILASIEEIFRTRQSAVSVVGALDDCRRPLFECLAGRLDPVLAKAVTLKVLNLCLAKYHYRSRHVELLSRPFGLIVDPSNFCNLACPGCVHSAHVKELGIFEWQTGLMPADRMAALYRTHGMYAIQTIFCNYGEPLMNPETPRIVRLAKSFAMRAMLSTNLSVGKLDAEALVLSGLDYMVVSLDGATQEVYEKFRKNGRIEVVFRNVRALVEAKRRLGLRTPVIAWHFLAFEHNAHEIPQALERARELGMNHFATLKPFDVSWDDASVRVADVAATTVQIDADNEIAIERNLEACPGGLDRDSIEQEFAVRWLDKPGARKLAARLQPVHSELTCHWLYKSMSMDSRGRVFPCCGAPTRERDLVFAQFDSGASPDPYNSEKYRLSRLSFSDPAAYRAAQAARLTGREPYCADCEWQKTTPNTDIPQIRQFLKTAAPGLFAPASVGLLTDW
jgi:MoaA/NifB/PqqE/SkfB family radical SAM enzyme